MTKNTMADVIGVAHSVKPGSYLGFPLFLPQTKKQAYLDLKEKVVKCISGWKAKFLSQIGRACLIKTIAFTLPSYFMSSFLLPNKYFQDLDTILRDFWWEFPQEKWRNFVPRAWASICCPKIAGGLGFQKFSDLNHALIAKKRWQIYDHGDKL